MEESPFTILFHQEDVSIELADPEIKEQWILAAITEENQPPGNLNFIFCSDAYLQEMNIKYLDHDTLTDVITFPMRRDRVEGDIFISTDRILENAAEFNVPFDQELSRVMIHGVLHLMGYKDKSEQDVEIMRAKENYYLQKL